MAFGKGFSQADAEAILSKLEANSEKFGGWKFEWGEELGHVGQINPECTVLRVVRR
ncbi:hypothetical protein KBC75_03715 [Candidatus Shapirobacteria bacterium]|nr:hypothetical protein [Candidatus Shapirobacteria bacterium]